MKPMLLDEIIHSIWKYREKVIEKGMELGLLYEREDGVISCHREKRNNFIVDEYLFTLQELDYWNSVVKG